MKIAGLLLVMSLPLVSSTMASSEVVKYDNSLAEDSIKEVVTVTTYHAVPGQTDNTPFVTASGYKINKRNPEDDKIIAISRDLKDRFKFGDSVLVTNTGKYDGVYYIHDVMNKRFTKKIDILISNKDSGDKFYNVIITKL
jgi:3D (Asp-Asp-Asp) domain-containing protein